MNAIIRFENVSKRYNLGLTRTSLPALVSQWAKSALGRAPDNTNQEKFFYALNNVSFELGKGESLALIGPNGAGKTTILKLLSQITKPTSGHIEAKGKLSALIELGAGFHPDLTGRENIYLNGTILGLKREEINRRFDEIVAFAELERFIDTPVKRYSSGMTVRLGFSVASFIEPDILLVDEVLAVGDASFRQKSMNRIKSLIDSGTSLIFVSHNLWLVQSVCQKALYIDHGEIKFRGLTSEVIDVYDKELNQQRAAKFDKPSGHKTVSGTEVEVIRVEALNRNGEVAQEFANHQSVEIRAHYLAAQSLDEVNVVIRIYRTDGLTTCMMRTKADGFKMGVKKGEGVISVTLDPIQLYGGTYYAQVLVRDASDAETIAIGWSEWFYVQGSALSHQEMNGVFEPNRRWKHYQNGNMTNAQEKSIDMFTQSYNIVGA